MPPDFQIQAPGYPSEFGVPGPAHDSQLDGLSARMGKRRASGPKKERRRTESINTAFAELRECIPNVPADTKLSKIKTLRLATSYIAYLMDVLAKDTGETEGFKAEIKKYDNRDMKRKREMVRLCKNVAYMKHQHIYATLICKWMICFNIIKTHRPILMHAF